MSVHVSCSFILTISQDEEICGTFIFNCELCGNMFANFKVLPQFRQSLYKQEPFSGWNNSRKLKIWEYICSPLSSFPRCFGITETGFAVKNVEHWDIIKGNQLSALLTRWKLTNQKSCQHQSQCSTKCSVTKSREFQNYGM